MSTQSVLTYVPASQCTLKRTSLPLMSRISISCMVLILTCLLTADLTGGNW